MANTTIRLLVLDYIQYRLQKQGYDWESPMNLPPVGPVQKTMRTLGDEFEERYTEVFQQMAGQLNITSNNANPIFYSIINELFADGIKWGRIVALFSFGASMAIKCHELNLPLNMTDQVVDLVTAYTEDHLQAWIYDHGGWDGFVKFYENSDKKNESPWPSVKTICSYAAGALGILTLGAILSQKS